ncbi:uncharacterized protein EDB91DRAFT_1141406 [Suillus paluster]|uniref:uncharacterized protein n=1 Tax=Suillus paluster TaxID=48578 RepID=UPI001B8681AB|nr:uncharacterized protein EDB91DRAFT_1141406 [Suillus paluster]KAG1736872.1 hypothetical protein EDB91DRAFT_1141406 [Suillus paluster]
MTKSRRVSLFIGAIGSISLGVPWAQVRVGSECLNSGPVHVQVAVPEVYSYPYPPRYLCFCHLSLFCTAQTHTMLPIMQCIAPRSDIMSTHISTSTIS